MFKTLIVDNNSDSAESLKKCLLKLCCDVAVADTVESGMEKIRASHYDAVFASLCLQTMSGRSLARWMKNSNGHGEKFFITTSWEGDLERGMLRFDGIHDIIKKPFSVNGIRDKLIEHLG